MPPTGCRYWSSVAPLAYVEVESSVVDRADNRICPSDDPGLIDSFGHIGPPRPRSVV